MKHMSLQKTLSIIRDVDSGGFDWDDAWDTLSSIDSSFRSELPLLRDTLEDPEPYVRIFAVKAICRIGGDLDLLIPDIIPLLRDTDQNVRAEAIRFFVRFGERSSEFLIPDVISLLKDTDQEVRAEAIRFLVRYGKGHASKAAPALLQLAADGKAYLSVRLRAFIACLKIKRQSGKPAGSHLNIRQSP